LRGNPLISRTNVVCSGGWSNGSDLLFRTLEWKRISVWTGCGTAFFFAGMAAGSATTKFQAVVDAKRKRLDEGRGVA